MIQLMVKSGARRRIFRIGKIERSMMRPDRWFAADVWLEDSPCTSTYIDNICLRMAKCRQVDLGELTDA